MPEHPLRTESWSADRLPPVAAADSASLASQILREPVCPGCDGSGYRTAPPIDITDDDYRWPCETCNDDGEGL